MSETPDEPTTGISDDQLPEDLVPGDDNPLAEGLPAGDDAGDLLHDGKPAAESDAGEAGDDAPGEASDTQH